MSTIVSHFPLNISETVRQLSDSKYTHVIEKQSAVQKDLWNGTHRPTN